MDTVALIPIVTAVIQVIKPFIGDTNNKWMPVVSIVLSILFMFVVAPDSGLQNILVQGLIQGLAASGLYSGGKTILAANK